MRRGRRLHNLILPARRVATFLALLGYLGSAVGLPVPRLAAQTHAGPSPCPSASCCCPTVEQCAQRCCCATPASGDSDLPEETATVSGSDTPSPSTTWIPAWRARPCQGIEGLWLSLQIAVSCSCPTVWTLELTPTDWISLPPDWVQGMATTPITPPPRA